MTVKELRGKIDSAIVGGMSDVEILIGVVPVGSNSCIPVRDWEMCQYPASGLIPAQIVLLGKSK